MFGLLARFPQSVDLVCPCEVASIGKTIAAGRVRFESLNAAALRAAQELLSAHNVRDRMTKQQAKTKTSNSSGPPSGPGLTGDAKKGPNNSAPLFEFAPGNAHQVQTFPTALAADQSDFANPFLVSDPSMANTLREDPMVKVALSAFLASWAQSTLRSNPGRAMCKMAEEPARKVEDCILAELGKRTLAIPSDMAELQQTVRPKLFAAAAGNEAAYMEADFLPSFRVTLQGSRQVVMVQIAALASHLGSDLSKADGLSRCSTAAINLTQAKVNELIRAVPTWACTVGPGDVLFTPAAWLVMECVSAAAGQHGGRGKDALNPNDLFGNT
jgi:hypothetical protein